MAKKTVVPKDIEEMLQKLNRILENLNYLRVYAVHPVTLAGIDREIGSTRLKLENIQNQIKQLKGHKDDSQKA